MEKGKEQTIKLHTQWHKQHPHFKQTNFPSHVSIISTVSDPSIIQNLVLQAKTKLMLFINCKSIITWFDQTQYKSTHIL